MYQRDHPQRSHRQALKHHDPHDRKEWDRIADEVHEVDDDLRERNPGASRAHRAENVRRREAARAGRWSGHAKTECGLHL